MAFAMARPLHRTQIGDSLLLALLLLAGAIVLWLELAPPERLQPAPPHPVTIRTASLAGSGTSIGPLTLAGALALSSDDRRLGGLSGLRALPDGRLLAISDAGDWLLFRPVVRGGQLVGVAAASLGGIALPAGAKADRDAEAVEFSGGDTLVSLEQQHRIARFAGIGAPLCHTGTLYRTGAMAWPPNGGGEALAALPGGALLWISEVARQAGGHSALLIGADGRTRAVAIAGVPGFAPTDAVAMDAGHLLLLGRHFNGINSAAALALVDLRPLLAGGTVAPTRLLATWNSDGPWPTDNMEGLALVREAGRPVLYLVSDDNFSPAQRTLLLRLALNLPGAAGQ